MDTDGVPRPPDEATVAEITGLLSYGAGWLSGGDAGDRAPERPHPRRSST